MREAFTRRCLVRGWTDTVSFFGWNRATAVVVLFWPLGALLGWAILGFDAVIGEIFQSALFGLIPLGAAAVAILTWNIVTAPKKLLAEAEKTADNLDAALQLISNKQASVDQLARLLSDAIHEIWNRPVENEDEFQLFRQYWEDWQRRVHDVLVANFSIADTLSFDRLGVVPIVRKAGSWDDPRYLKIMQEYALKEARLREIIRDHNVTHIKVR